MGLVYMPVAILYWCIYYVYLEQLINEKSAELNPTQIICLHDQVLVILFGAAITIVVKALGLPLFLYYFYTAGYQRTALYSGSNYLPDYFPYLLLILTQLYFFFSLMNVLWYTKLAAVKMTYKEFMLISSQAQATNYTGKKYTVREQIRNF